MSDPANWLRLENRHTGEILEIRRRPENGQVILDLKGSLPPRSEGPPLHVHHREDEEGTVVAGRISLLLDGRRSEAGPGETVRLPRGVPHRWWNAGNQPLVFDGRVVPVVDLDRYLQAIFEIANAGPPDRPPLFYLAHLALRHRDTQSVLAMPTLLQAILFRVAVAVGTLLGRYRGTEWPGCPARCVGAPVVGPDGSGFATGSRPG